VTFRLWMPSIVDSSSSSRKGANSILSNIAPIDGNMKLKLRKPVTARCGKMQAVCPLVSAVAVHSCLFVEFFVLKWSGATSSKGFVINI